MGFGRAKVCEVIDEVRSVVLSRGRYLDALLPPAVFLATKTLAGDQAAMIAALLAGGALAAFRGLRRQPATFALLGLSGSLLAFLAAQWLQRAELFFLPEWITNAALAAFCLTSAGLWLHGRATWSVVGPATGTGTRVSSRPTPRSRSPGRGTSWSRPPSCGRCSCDKTLPGWRSPAC